MVSSSISNPPTMKKSQGGVRRRFQSSMLFRSKQNLNSLQVKLFLKAQKMLNIPGPRPNACHLYQPDSFKNHSPSFSLLSDSLFQLQVNPEDGVEKETAEQFCTEHLLQGMLGMDCYCYCLHFDPYRIRQAKLPMSAQRYGASECCISTFSMPGPGLSHRKLSWVTVPGLGGT